jgi:hypothetical protein
MCRVGPSGSNPAVPVRSACTALLLSVCKIGRPTASAAAPTCSAAAPPRNVEGRVEGTGSYGAAPFAICTDTA